MEEEAGSGIPAEASGADEPVGKSQLFHFITHKALGVFGRVFVCLFVFKEWVGQAHILFLADIITQSCHH